MNFSVNGSGVLRSQIDNKVIIAVRTGAFAVLDETNVVVGFSRSFFFLHYIYKVLTFSFPFFLSFWYKYEMYKRQNKRLHKKPNNIYTS
jgi:hypothetical protein